MIPIYKIDPEYPRCIKKLSKKRRKPCKKNTGVLEYGKTGVIFKLPYKAKDSTLENTSSCPDVIATETYKSLPEWIQERVEGIYVGDYEFLSNKFEKVGEVA